MHKSSCIKLFRIEFPRGEEQSTMGTGAIKNLRPVLMVSIMFSSFFKKNPPCSPPFLWRSREVSPKSASFPSSFPVSPAKLPLCGFGPPSDSPWMKNWHLRNRPSSFPFFAAVASGTTFICHPRSIGDSPNKSESINEQSGRVLSPIQEDIFPTCIDTFDESSKVVFCTAESVQSAAEREGRRLIINNHGASSSSLMM